MKLCFLTLVLAAGLCGQIPCLPVSGDQITTTDLARAIPAFASIPQDIPLAPAPLPGSTRLFSVSELQSIATRFPVSTHSFSEACFRLALQPLDRDRVMAAMRKALQIPDARIELFELSPAPVPAGTIEFTRENLVPPALIDQPTPVLWRGDVAYSGGRRFGIWARVTVTAPVAKLVAVEALRTGVPIQASQVRMEIVDSFPVVGNDLTAERVAGMLLLRPVPAGSEIRSDNVTRPNEVNRGDIIRVEVHVGGAYLSLTGRAESGGRIGDMITVRNPETSKSFQALVESSGRVLVEPIANE